MWAKAPRRRPVVHVKAHVAPLEALVHIPFLLELANFFLPPEEEEGDELYAAAVMKATVNRVTKLRQEPPPDLLLYWDWRLDLRLDQLALVVMNHSLGPNMPLARFAVRGAYVAAAAQEGSDLQLDAQLPLEGHSYNHTIQAYPYL